MIELIPAIDIIDGKCVRLEEGNYRKKKIYSIDPVRVAMEFESWGLSKLHLVDLDGAKLKKPVNLNILEKIASETNLEIDFGGGIRKKEDAQLVFASGASMITVGSMAVKEPDEFYNWLGVFGNEKIILGADHLSGKISVNAWKEPTEYNLVEFIKTYAEKGIKYVLCTDISRDGMMSGPSFDLYKEILDNCPGIKLIASGGVRDMNDITGLNSAGLFGVVVGKALYEKKIDKKAISGFLKSNYII